MDRNIIYLRHISDFQKINAGLEKARREIEEQSRQEELRQKDELREKEQQRKQEEVRAARLRTAEVLRKNEELRKKEELRKQEELRIAEDLRKKEELRKSKEFFNTCKDECSQNLADLLFDNVSSDVKLLMKDKTELPAHKTILWARCPVFASMSGSDFLETRNALVNVDDISSKTMKILLKFWYSGELLPSWKDDDVVVEFAYAVGKYQVTRLLKMLDDNLGCDDFHATDGDLELLKMVQKLSLQNAEARILKRIVYKISQATSGAEILDLFSIDEENLDAKMLVASEIFVAFDEVLFERDETDACSRHVKLLAMASKLGTKNVETKLLQRIKLAVNKVDSANALFSLFDLKNETNEENYATSDLLVRACPK